MGLLSFFLLILFIFILLFYFLPASHCLFDVQWISPFCIMLLSDGHTHDFLSIIIFVSFSYFFSFLFYFSITSFVFSSILSNPFFTLFIFIVYSNAHINKQFPSATMMVPLSLLTLVCTYFFSFSFLSYYCLQQPVCTVLQSIRNIYLYLSIYLSTYLSTDICYPFICKYNK